MRQNVVRVDLEAQVNNMNNYKQTTDRDVKIYVPKKYIYKELFTFRGEYLPPDAKITSGVIRNFVDTINNLG